VVLVNVSHCAHAVMVDWIVKTEATSSTAVRFVFILCYIAELLQICILYFRVRSLVLPYFQLSTLVSSFSCCQAWITSSMSFQHHPSTCSGIVSELSFSCNPSVVSAVEERPFHLFWFLMFPSDKTVIDWLIGRLIESCIVVRRLVCACDQNFVFSSTK